MSIVLLYRIWCNVLHNLKYSAFQSSHHMQNGGLQQPKWWGVHAKKYNFKYFLIKLQTLELYTIKADSFLYLNTYLNPAFMNKCYSFRWSFEKEKNICSKCY